MHTRQPVGSDWFRCRVRAYQDGQQQRHVASAEYGEEDGVDHEQEVWGGERGEQVDHAAQDEVGLVVVVLVGAVPVRHPAGRQLGHSLCDAWNDRPH